MKSTNFMDEASPDADMEESNQRLRVVIAYDELSAGKRGMDLLLHIRGQLGNSVEFETMPWPSDLLADTDWHNAAINDALKADILIIASSAKAGPLLPPVAQWAESVIRRKQGTGAAVVAMFIADGFPDGDDSPRLASIRRLAQESGLECFAPARTGDLDRALAEIHRRAEVVTPVLEGILNTHTAPQRSTEARP